MRQKYIAADKLKTEIRKLRSESCISEADDYYEYVKSEIIDIIDSLQQDDSLARLTKRKIVNVAPVYRVCGNCKKAYFSVEKGLCCMCPKDNHGQKIVDEYGWCKGFKLAKKKDWSV